MRAVYSTNEFWLILVLIIAMWVIAILMISMLHYKRRLDWYAVKHGDKEPIEKTALNARENINIYSWIMLNAVIEMVWAFRKKTIFYNFLTVRQLIVNKLVK